MALLRNLKPGQQAKIFRSKWDGMAPDLDPQNLPENRPFAAINTREEGGQLVIRGGERRLLGELGKVTGLGTHKQGAGAISGGPSWYGGATIECVIFNQQFPGDPSVTGGMFRRAAPSNQSYSGDSLAVFGDDVVGHFHDGAGRYFLGRIVATGPPFWVAGTVPDLEILLEVPIQGIDCMVEHNGELLISIDNGVVTDIWKYDGVTLTQDLAGITRVKGLGIYNDKAVLVFDNGGTNAVRIRSAAGVWGAPIAPGAGVVGCIVNNCFAQYKNKFYIPKQNYATSDAFVLDSASVVTRLPTGTTGIDAGGAIMAFATFNRKLYFVWTTATNDHLWIGSFDGTTWTPKVKDLNAQASFTEFMGTAIWNNAGTVQLPGALKNYRGSLGVACQAGVFLSQGTNIAGSWTFVAGPGHAPISSLQAGGVIK